MIRGDRNQNHEQNFDRIDDQVDFRDLNPIKTELIPIRRQILTETVRIENLKNRGEIEA